jgi:hypothetical protein
VGKHKSLVDRQEVRFYIERVGLQRAGQKQCQEEQEDAHVFALADLGMGPCWLGLIK